MTRRIACSLLFLGSVGMGAPAAAQIYHPGGHHDAGGHYDVIPGHFHPHNGHLDYHPPQTIYHPSPFRGHSTYPTYPSTGHYPTSGYPRTFSSSPQVIVRQPVSQWNSFGHVDELAMQLERQTNTMCLEMYYNYQRNPGFHETYREAYEILATTKEIHAMEHAGDREGMRQAALRIDELFHHVQDDVRHWARYGQRYFGPGGLRARMDDVEDTLHHLMQDVGANSQIAGGGVEETAPPALSPGLIPQP